MDGVRGGCEVVCSKDCFSPKPESESMTSVADRFSRISNSVAQQCEAFASLFEPKDSAVNINASHDHIVKHDTKQKHAEWSMILGRVKTTMDWTWNETTMTSPYERMRSVDSGWSKSR